MLKDKTALITGGGRGVGREVALRLAAEGVKVFIVSRTESELKAVKEEISASGGLCEYALCDMTDENSVKAAAEAAVDAFGGVDILVNNAGMQKLARIAEMSVSDWDETMNTNFRGVFLMTKEILPGMEARKSGRIINIGSMAGRRGYECQGAYCSSKHALVGFTKVLALEEKKYGIRVNLVSPGGIVTKLSEDLRVSRGDKGSADDWMTVEEIADGIIYLCKQEGVAFTDELVLRRFESEPWR